METVQVSRETLSIAKACERAGVSRRTVYNWLNAGKLEFLRTAGGAIRIYADTLFRPADHQRTPTLVGSSGR